MSIKYTSHDDTTPREPQAEASPPPIKKPLPRGLMAQQETPGDQRLENKIRPQALDEYIGQQALKERLHIGIQAAKHRQEPLDHILLYGPPGLGKTTLAMILAKEMETEVHITAAPALERPRDIIGLLMGLQAGSVLFIDEIHRMNKLTEEILYPAMEDFTLDRTVGSGPSARILRIPLPKFTLVGATTKAGAISNPLRDRFGMSFRLGYYQEAELTTILHRAATILEIEIHPKGASAIAKRGRGTPRIANRLLKRVRDYVEVTCRNQGTPPIITEAMANQALDLFEIDPLGLDHTDRLILKTIIERFSGGPVGLDTLSSVIGEDTRTIEDVYEPYLLQLGFLNRTPRGRVATLKACHHLGINAAQYPQLAQIGLPLTLDLEEI